MQVLVVDDDHVIRSLLERILKREGWNAVRAQSGQEALEIFRPGLFQWAIIDVGLGQGMDGIQVALRLQIRDSNVQIIMISGDPASEERTRQSGLKRFHLKPIDPSSLVSILRSETFPKQS